MANTMKNIYKSKVAKAYHRHRNINRYWLLVSVLLIIAGTIIAMEIGMLYEKKVISDIQLAAIIVGIAFVCCVVMIIIGLYNGSYIEEDLNDFDRFAKKYNLIKGQREYKRRERKNKKWLM